MIPRSASHVSTTKRRIRRTDTRTDDRDAWDSSTAATVLAVKVHKVLGLVAWGSGSGRGRLGGGRHCCT